MAGTKEIKTRIKSIQSTRQITKAMEIVSTTKFKKFSKLVADSKPYEDSMKRILANISGSIKSERHPLFDGRVKVEKIAIIVVTSDRGLCGSFNSATLKELEKLIAVNKGKKINIISLGRKSRDYSIKRNYRLNDTYVKIEADQIADISKDISFKVVEKYEKNEYDEVYMIYNKFVSALRYDLTCERIIPMERVQTDKNEEYIFEPDTETILASLLPRYLNVQIYQAILHNTASEYSARKNAMSNATENADEMLQNLNLKYNRNRQSTITQEITEIVGGASAL